MIVYAVVDTRSRRRSPSATRSTSESAGRTPSASSRRFEATSRSSPRTCGSRGGASSTRAGGTQATWTTQAIEGHRAGVGLRRSSPVSAEPVSTTALFEVDTCPDLKVRPEPALAEPSRSGLPSSGLAVIRIGAAIGSFIVEHWVFWSDGHNVVPYRPSCSEREFGGEATEPVPLARPQAGSNGY
jgi:hypothetical protein